MSRISSEELHMHAATLHADVQSCACPIVREDTSYTYVDMQANPARLVLIADEADELWTYHMTPEHVRTATACKITQREQQMYSLLRCIPGLHSFIQVISDCEYGTI